ncbi:hypothetical protein CONLIGDRAFT_644066 [Coniochaeta ligniaria NRRL 30616]|uniref:Uncharacterized protein n=1 Tax=Coniochaeta ligniaria NRRL 30616 TaxID=1408157 RepID=A0A1J7JL80_9PEZI|nr:hypothetical protein CONLIGDRAFT_644066 [Coniochaeta ligniaria NRRL 30616]
MAMASRGTPATCLLKYPPRARWNDLCQDPAWQGAVALSSSCTVTQRRWQSTKCRDIQLATPAFVSPGVGPRTTPAWAHRTARLLPVAATSPINVELLKALLQPVKEFVEKITDIEDQVLVFWYNDEEPPYPDFLPTWRPDDTVASYRVDLMAMPALQSLGRHTSAFLAKRIAELGAK